MSKKKIKPVNYHVAYNDGMGDWVVTAEGAPYSYLTTKSTQEEALAVARELRGSAGGQIKVHQLDGTFSDMSE